MYNKVVIQVHEMSREESKGDINENNRDMLNGFEAETVVEDDVGETRHRPVRDASRFGERFFTYSK